MNSYPCRYCGAPIRFTMTGKGSWRPVDHVSGKHHTCERILPDPEHTESVNAMIAAENYKRQLNIAAAQAARGSSETE